MPRQPREDSTKDDVESILDWVESWRPEMLVCVEHVLRQPFARVTNALARSMMLVGFQAGIAVADEPQDDPLPPEPDEHEDEIMELQLELEQHKQRIHELEAQLSACTKPVGEG